jgi:hypothetical protein
MRFVVVLLLQALSAIVHAQELTMQLESHSVGGHSKRIGQLSIDNADVKQERCQVVDPEVCAREAGGDFEFAFVAYESRYEECGLAGWKTEGILGRGHVSAVALRDTPCGLDVAMKGTHSPSTQEDINLDCHIMKMLMTYQNDPRCNGCFPKYYFLSNYTGVCYAEHVASVPIAVYFDHVNANSTAGFQHVRKAFVEGLGALSVLQEAGVKHRDLTFRNILIRLPSEPSKEYQVVVMDFGGSQTVQFGVAPNVRAIVLGGHGRSDLFSYTCGYIKYFYPQYPWCKSLRQYNIPVLGEPRTFLRFLTDTLRIAQNKAIVPNYTTLLASVQAVESL